ncbi:MAG: hypothetical protein JKY01_05730, partial [Pseudomonadales bacterium]|nr:hypothetical protein [Pseudomonadales bacterium]
NMASLLGAFFLIRGETYQEYVEFRNTLFADIKEAREAVEKEIKEAIEKETNGR